MRKEAASWNKPFSRANRGGWSGKKKLVSENGDPAPPPEVRDRRGFNLSVRGRSEVAAEDLATRPRAEGTEGHRGDRARQEPDAAVTQSDVDPASVAGFEREVRPGVVVGPT